MAECKSLSLFDPMFDRTMMEGENRAINHIIASIGPILDDAAANDRRLEVTNER